MTREDKDLLLKDLCGRLPHGVICTDSRHGDSRITEIDTRSRIVYFDDVDEYVEIEKCKPYLRPILSMTEKERQEYGLVLCGELSINQHDWLNAHHFDYRGLIEKGLAIEAPKGMYN